MMLAALVFLLCGAVAGTFLAVRHFLRRRLPVWVAVLHGLGGATGFTLVLLAVVREPEFMPARQALYLLIATVALGCVNLVFHVRRVRHRTSLIVMHALTALSAAGTLLYAIVVHTPDAGAPVTPPTDTASASSAPLVAAAPSFGAPPPATAAATETAALPAAPPSASSPGPAAFSLDPAVTRTLARPIHFGTNGADVMTASSTAIADISRALKEHPEIELLEVQGHADARGEDSHNLGLAKTRASVVLETLVALGVARSRLRLAAYGARCPANQACGGEQPPTSCTSPESWDRDRRVVLVPLRVAAVPFKGPLVCARGAELIPAEDRQFHSP